MSMKIALEQAFRKAGEKLPVSTKKRGQKKRSGSPAAHKRHVENKPEWKKDVISPQIGIRTEKNSALDVKPDPVPDLPKPTIYEVEIASDAAPKFHSGQQRKNNKLLFNEQGENETWRITKVPIGATQEELFMGLDFGTSSVKAVIGDQNRKIHYAVPFSEALNIEHYLLPSIVYQSGDCFSLSGESEIGHRRLKLDLMDNPSSEIAQRSVVAFLSLAIRRIRSWFFINHSITYKQSDLLWSLNIGVPSATYGSFSEIMKMLGWAAWIAALSEGEITTDVISRAMYRAVELLNDEADPKPSEDVEVNATLEIAAQVYGYVKSDAFDPDAQNLFVMADVGAGTVDCALFKVRRQDALNEEFLFYAKSVEPLGVANLHRHRLQWWEHVFTTLEDGADELLGAVAEELISMDIFRPVPDKFSNYFTGVAVKSSPKGSLGIDNPDAQFEAKLKKQIQENTLEKARRAGDWHKDALRNTPFLLSGGGTRNKYYQRIKESVRHHSSHGYLRLDPKPFTPPSNITAPGLRQKDWDRLSVAYGLSFRSAGKATFV